ncbi:hypothetical protein [Glutamicibacter arilaitensis]|uniref:hypothetical protein n=1 Tax=Glutamicibacter arilaitensis TaxID=256701 RepID=UPI003FCF5C21
MKRIREYYSVPAKRGMRIKFEGRPCTITGTTSGQMYLRIRYDGDPKRTYPIHPTWEVEYPEAGE